MARASAGPLVIGATVPLSGPYAAEGAAMLDGIRLAAAHVNAGGGGMLETFSSTAISGGGVLGRPLRVSAADTAARTAQGRAAAARLLQDEGAEALVGSSSSGSATAIAELAASRGRLYMAGIAHAPEFTGRDLQPTAFRHFINAEISARALAPALSRLWGRDRTAIHLSSANGWGAGQEAALVAKTEAEGWRTLDRRIAPLATLDYAPHLADLPRGADTLVLSLYGGNLVAALATIRRLNLAERFRIAAPLLTTLVAGAAGEAAAGILGIGDWHHSAPTAGTAAFASAFRGATGRNPSEAARTGYVQTLLWADAAARAGTLEPCALAAALEGFGFDGLGCGPTLIRGADHQAFRAVPLLEGTGHAADPLAFLERIPARDLVYPPEPPAALRCTGPA